MTTQIGIEILFGARDVKDTDRERAEAAALAILAEAKVTPEAAHEDFRRQWAWLGTDEAAEAGKCQSYKALTGLAALWVAAEDAANAALTEGWRNPAGANCTIYL